MVAGLLWLHWDFYPFEGRACRHLLRIRACVDLWLPSLVCYLDSAVALSLISQEANPHHLHEAVMQGVRDLLARCWTVLLLHTWREGNSCADALAKLGVRQREVLRTMESPPGVLRPLLLGDELRVPHVRGER